MAYSPFFCLLHDERSPVGNLGRGTHYSIARAAVPRSLDDDVAARVEGESLAGLRRSSLDQLDFAIIWDEDHDERIWTVIERLHVSGLLAPVRFIGERKGNVTLLVDEDTDFGEGGAGMYEELVEHAVSDSPIEDHWSVAVSVGKHGKSGIISDAPSKVDAYLLGIRACWDLGPRPWIFTKTNSAI